MHYNAVSKRLRDGCFVGHFKCNEMSSSTTFTIRTLRLFLEYIFKELFINKALPALNSVCRQNFMAKNCKR